MAWAGLRIWIKENYEGWISSNEIRAKIFVKLPKRLLLESFPEEYTDLERLKYIVKLNKCKNVLKKQNFLILNCNFFFFAQSESINITTPIKINPRMHYQHWQLRRDGGMAKVPTHKKERLLLKIEIIFHGDIYFSRRSRKLEILGQKLRQSQFSGEILPSLRIF